MASSCRLVCWCMDLIYEPRSDGGCGEPWKLMVNDSWEDDMMDDSRRTGINDVVRWLAVNSSWYF